MTGRSSHDDAEAGDDASRGRALLVSPDRVTADLGAEIHDVCVKRRKMSLNRLAARSGVSIGRLRKFIENDPDNTPRPRLDEAMSIWKILGKAAANASLEAIGMIAEDADAEAARLRVLVADASRANSTLATIAIDDEIDPDEADLGISAGEQMIEAGFRLRAAAERAKRR